MKGIAHALGGVCLVSAWVIAGCGGDDGLGGALDANVPGAGQDAGLEAEVLGPGAGRGRGGPLLESTDGGVLAEADASADAGGEPMPGAAPDAATVNADAMAPSCNRKVCEEIHTRYLTAFAKAQACRTLAKEQCKDQAESDLKCGALAWVNDGASLDPLRKDWVAADCDMCKWECRPVIKPVSGEGYCAKNTSTMSAYTVAPVILDPPVIIDPPPIINLNDGTCARKLLLAP